MMEEGLWELYLEVQVLSDVCWAFILLLHPILCLYYSLTWIYFV